MKQFKIVMPTAAIVALLGTSAVFAQSTTDVRTVTANVGVALQGDTGFLTGGQVQVNGVGNGIVQLTRGAAHIGLTSGAVGRIDSDTDIPESSSRMITTFDFDRSVNTSAALVGIGNVIAQGESIGGTGVVGTASANATRAGTIIDENNNTAAGTASAPTNATASLVGQMSTQSTMQLQGQSSLFAGAQSLNLGERNAALSGGRTGLISADASEVDLDNAGVNFDAQTNVQRIDENDDLLFVAPNGSLTTDADGGNNPPAFTFARAIPTMTGNGAIFQSISQLEQDVIDINVASAGGGSVLVSGSTGGFFGQGTGATAGAAPTFPQTNGFFGINP